MENDNLYNLKKDLYTVDNIRSCVDVSEKENLTLRNNYIYDLVIGIDEYDNFDKIINSVQKDKKYILNSISEQIYIDSKYVEYKVFFEDGILFNINILENSSIKSYLSKYKKFDVILDKDKIFKDYKFSQVLKNNWSIPNKDDFIEECIDFFLELVEMVLNYEEGNIINTNMIKQSLIDKLIYMGNTYMSIKYKNGVRLNQYGLNFKTYLDKEYFDEFQYILLSGGREDIWTVIFKSAQLFRSMAMEVAKLMEYSYPKRDDVKTLEILRNIYNGAKNE